LNFETINDWLQFGAALTTIVVAPWALNAFRIFVRSKISVLCAVDDTNNEENVWEWRVEIKNRSTSTNGILISACPLTHQSSVIGYYYPEPKDRHFNVVHELNNGKLYVDVNFWPTRRPLKLVIRMNSPDYLDFFVDGKSQPTKYDIVSFSPKFSKNRYVGIQMARLRSTFVLVQFVAIGAAALLKIAYLGLFGRVA
jgi:hypothetical protein